MTRQKRLQPSGDVTSTIEGLDVQQNGATVARMHLIQIGQPAAPLTVLQFVEEMADRQWNEIEQLKQAALSRQYETARAGRRRKSA